MGPVFLAHDRIVALYRDLSHKVYRRFDSEDTDRLTRLSLQPRLQQLDLALSMVLIEERSSHE